MGLCAAHYRQHLREEERPPRKRRPLRPVREEARPRVRVRVSQPCYDALEAEGPSAMDAARHVLEVWARRRAAAP